MTKPVLLLTWISLLLLSSACSHFYYAPNTLQTPFLQQQHDAQISGGVVSGSDLSGSELHFAYSPVKYGAVMVNSFDLRSYQPKTSNPDIWGELSLLEFASGVYYPTSKYTSISLFGGWGSGRVQNSYNLDILAGMRFQKLFLQPAFAIQTKWLRIGMALRFNQLKYKRGDVDSRIDRKTFITIQNLEKASSIFIPETGFSLGLGHKALWVDVHLNICHPRRRAELGIMPSTFGTAVTLELDKLWRKE